MTPNDYLSHIIIPSLDFEGGRMDEKFCRFFLNLYRIGLYKDGLDLILTKLKKRQIRFEITIAKDWDTNLGCYLSSQSAEFDQKLGKFVNKRCEKIVLRSFSYNVLAHEMAHACEFNSDIDLGEDFRKAVALDMKDRRASNVALDSEIQRLMIDALRAYKPHQILSELFARYFELLSLSRLVAANAAFGGDEVLNFFTNVSKFVAQIFNPQIRKKIDPEIAAQTIEIAKSVMINQPENKFADQIDSRQQKFTNSVKSNNAWLEAFQGIRRVEENSKKHN